MMMKDDLHLFSFTKANFLQSGTVLLPELFSEYRELCDEARMVGMTEFIEMLQELSGMYLTFINLKSTRGNLNHCNGTKS